jgi:hypothetical protein
MVTSSLIGGIILTHYSQYMLLMPMSLIGWKSFVYNLGEHKPYLSYDSYGNESLEKKRMFLKKI